MLYLCSVGLVRLLNITEYTFLVRLIHKHPLLQLFLSQLLMHSARTHLIALLTFQRPPRIWARRVCSLVYLNSALLVFLLHSFLDGLASVVSGKEVGRWAYVWAGDFSSEGLIVRRYAPWQVFIFTRSCWQQGSRRCHRFNYISGGDTTSDEVLGCAVTQCKLSFTRAVRVSILRLQCLKITRS